MKKTANTRTSKSKKKSRKKRGLVAPRKCRFCEASVSAVDYKDTNLLRRYISTRGKILAARFTGTCAKHQRKLGQAVRRSRFMALLPYLIR